MQDPQYPIELIGGQWNLIATGVTEGIVHRKIPCKHYQTYRLPLSAPPTLIGEGVLMFQDKPLEELIDSPAAINVYIWPVINSTVRLDV